jgi:hypothetical protein
MAKVRNILPDERIYRQSTGDRAGLSGRPWEGLSSRTGGSKQCAQKIRTLLLRGGWAAKFRDV